LREIAVTIVALDEHQADIARDAFARFGKGQHRAGLNFGDCAAYALAMAEGEPLLFKGTDFAATDVQVAQAG
jgi:ribonuclease VapC